MKYLLFAGSDCYPKGGVEDFVGSFDSIEAARDAAPNDDWAHIACFTTKGDFLILESFRLRRCVGVSEITRSDGEICHKYHFGPAWIRGGEYANSNL